MYCGIISESWRKNKWKIYRILFSFRTKSHFRVKIKFKEIHTCTCISFNLFIANFVSIYKCTKKIFYSTFSTHFSSSENHSLPVNPQFGNTIPVVRFDRCRTIFHRRHERLNFAPRFLIQFASLINVAVAL